MFGIGLQELIIILVICLIIFGANKLPDIAKALGKSMQEFKKACKDSQQDLPESISSTKDSSKNPEENKS